MRTVQHRAINSLLTHGIHTSCVGNCCLNLDWYVCSFITAALVVNFSHCFDFMSEHKSNSVALLSVCDWETVKLSRWSDFTLFVGFMSMTVKPLANVSSNYYKTRILTWSDLMYFLSLLMQCLSLLMRRGIDQRSPLVCEIVVGFRNSLEKPGWYATGCRSKK